MDKYKKQQLELDELRREFVSLDTEEQRAEFDKKMKQVIFASEMDYFGSQIQSNIDFLGFNIRKYNGKLLTFHT